MRELHIRVEGIEHGLAKFGTSHRFRGCEREGDQGSHEKCSGAQVDGGKSGERMQEF